MHFLNYAYFYLSIRFDGSQNKTPWMQGLSCHNQEYVFG